MGVVFAPCHARVTARVRGRTRELCTVWDAVREFRDGMQTGMKRPRGRKAEKEKTAGSCPLKKTQNLEKKEVQK